MINDRTVGIFAHKPRGGDKSCTRNRKGTLKIDVLQNAWLDYYATPPKRKRAMNNSPRDNLRFNQAAVFAAYTRTHAHAAVIMPLDPRRSFASLD